MRKRKMWAVGRITVALLFILAVKMLTVPAEIYGKQEEGKAEEEVCIPISFLGIDGAAEQEIVYGTKGYSIEVDRELFAETAGLTQEEEKEVFYSYKLQSGTPQDVLTVDEAGEVTVYQASQTPVCIVVTRSDVGRHKGTSAEYWIRVQPKEITLDTGYEGLTFEKVYDKTDNKVFHNPDTQDILEGVGQLPLIEPDRNEGRSGIEPGDNVFVSSLEGLLPMAFQNVHTDDSGQEVPYEEKAEVPITKAELGGEDAGNYKIDLDSHKITLKTKITVKKREIWMQVSDGERQYGHWNEVLYHSESPVTEWRNAYTNPEIQGILYGDNVLFPNPEEKEITEENHPDYALQTWPDKLTVCPTDAQGRKNGNPGQNYKFDFHDHRIKKGALTVMKEQIDRNDLDFPDRKENVHISSEGQVWTDDQNEKFHINIRGEAAAYYDAVYVKDRGQEIRTDGLSSGYDFTKKQYQDGETQILQVYLKNTRNGAVSQDLEVPVRIDSKAPVLLSVTAGEEIHPLEKGLNRITFGRFHPALSRRIETASVSDGEGCGIKQWAVHVMKGERDEDFTGEAIEKHIEPKNQDCIWTAMEGRTEDAAVLEGSIEIPDKEDNYIILVKIIDHVGHTKVYASNGIVVDCTAPRASIEIAGKESSTGIYGEDVKLNIHVEDTEAGSALQKVEVYVRNHGKLTQKDVLWDMKANTQKHSWKRRELNQYHFKDFVYMVKAEKNNSNHVRVTVMVTDNAGNQSSQELMLMFDVTRPLVEVTRSSEAAAENGMYYNRPVRTEIVYTERNFSRDQHHLWFLAETEEKQQKRYSLQELKKQLGIQAKWEELEENVQQDQRAREDLTDERQHKLVLIFDRDNYYKITPYFKDLSEYREDRNGSVSGEMQEFIIDQKAPVMRVEYRRRDGSCVSVPEQEKNRIYEKESVGIYVSIEEHNFALKNQEVSVEVKVETGKTESLLPDYTTQQKANDEQTWRMQNKDCYESNYWLSEDADYIHSITYTDLAGNSVSCGPGYVTVDKTKPLGRIEMKGFGFWERFLEKISFGLFSAADVDVLMTGTDATSPVVPLQFLVVEETMTKEELETCKGWRSASEDSPGFVGISVNQEQSLLIYTKVTDLAGNYAFFSSDGMIIDRTSPSPAVFITNLNQAANGIFPQDVKLRIEAEELFSGNTYSGLKKVWYIVSDAKNAGCRDQIELLNDSKSKKRGTQKFSKVITIPAERYHSNHVIVEAFAEDWAGNQGKSGEIKLKIDTERPTISLFWNSPRPMNGRYYKEARIATVMVSERNFDPQKVQFHITNTKGKSPCIGTWSANTRLEETIHTCQVTFQEDGEYTFTLDCTDLAGNYGKYEQTEKFIIDKTRPVLAVSYDQEKAKNGKYFRKPRTATITIREDNFKEEEVQVSIAADLKKAKGLKPSVSRFLKKDGIYTASVIYREDGDYTFAVSCTDLAGNQSSVYTPDSFTIDQTAPDLSITGVQDKSANNDIVAPAIKATDENYDEKGLSITVTGNRKGKIEPGRTVHSVSGGQLVNLHDIPRKEEMDDLYQLTAQATDKAGNTTRREIQFSVNRYGSVFFLDQPTEQWLYPHEKSYCYIKEEKEVGIHEVNVNAIEARSISISHNGELRILKEGIDYTVRTYDQETKWKGSYYVLAKENFEQEGHYVIVLHTQDQAHNTMNNASFRKADKALPLEFAVDKTAPTVVISGVENDTQYRTAEQTMTVDVKDNLALTKVKINVDGTEHVYERDQLKKNHGVLDVRIQGADYWQKIEITAEDAAGNRLDRPIQIRVLVTPNLIVQYYMQKPLFYGSVAFVAVMMAGIFLLIQKKKKGKEKRRK